MKAFYGTIQGSGKRLTCTGGKPGIEATLAGADVSVQVEIKRIGDQDMLFVAIHEGTTSNGERVGRGPVLRYGLTATQLRNGLEPWRAER